MLIHFFFFILQMYFHKNISLYKSFFFFFQFINMLSILRDASSSSSLVQVTRTFARVQCLCSFPFTRNPFGAKQDMDIVSFVFFTYAVFLFVFFLPAEVFSLGGGRADLALALQSHDFCLVWGLVEKTYWAGIN